MQLKKRIRAGALLLAAALLPILAAGGYTAQTRPLPPVRPPRRREPLPCPRDS